MSTPVAFRILNPDHTQGDAWPGDESFTTPAIACGYDKRLSLTISWTDDIAGTFTLVGRDFDTQQFTEIPGADAEFSGKQPDGANEGSYIYNWVNMPCKEWALQFETTSGDGEIRITGTQGDLIQT